MQQSISPLHSPIVDTIKLSCLSNKDVIIIYEHEKTMNQEMIQKQGQCSFIIHCADLFQMSFYVQKTDTRTQHTIIIIIKIIISSLLH